MATPLCLCGCGREVGLSQITSAARGVVKGQPQRFVRGHNKNGRLRSTPEYTVDPTTGCWNWNGHISASGYPNRVKDTAGRRQRAHRVCFERVKGPIPAGLQLDHLCRNRRCVNPDHLEPVTNAENSRRSTATKLDADAVRRIRVLAGTMTQEAIAAVFGITSRNVSSIVRGDSWKDVA